MPSSPLPTVTDIQHPCADTTPLGYAVFWRLSGVQIPYTDLVSLLVARGFAPYRPDPPTPTTALRRALQRWASPGLLVRTITRDPLVLALVEEWADLHGLDLVHRTRLRVCYEPTRHTILCTRTTSGPIAPATSDGVLTGQFRPLWEEACQMLVGEDLARLLRAIILDLHAVRLQRGVYFVSARYQDLLARLDRLVCALPGSPLLATLVRIDDRQTRQHLAHTVHREMLRELASMEEDLHQVLAAPQPSLPAVTRRLARFRTLQTKAQVYADLLAERAAQLTERLEQVRTQAGQLFLFGADSFSELPEAA